MARHLAALGKKCSIFLTASAFPGQSRSRDAEKHKYDDETDWKS
jgi:hypothetical protein